MKIHVNVQEVRLNRVLGLADVIKDLIGKR